MDGSVSSPCFRVVVYDRGVRMTVIKALLLLFVLGLLWFGQVLSGHYMSGELIIFMAIILLACLDDD